MTDHDHYETRVEVQIFDSWISGLKWGIFGGFLLGAILMKFMP